MSKNHNRGEGKNRFDDNRPDPELEAPDVLDEAESAEELDVSGLGGDSREEPNSLTFTTYPLTPVEVKYRVQITRLEDMFLKILQSYITDIEEVFCETDRRTGDVMWFCRFSEGSSHFDDGSLRFTAISDKKVEYLSPELRKFANKFGMNPKQDLLRGNNGEILNKAFMEQSRVRNLSGGKTGINQKLLFCRNEDGAGNLVNSWSMRLSWTTLVQIIFDKDGRVFQEKYKKRPPRCNINVSWVYGKSSGGDKTGDARFLEVIKSASNSGYERPRPRGAFRDSYRK